MQKQCSKCRLELPLELFSKSKRGLFGRKSDCKKCAYTMFKKWEAEKIKDPEYVCKRSKQASEWARKNPEKRSAIAIRRNKKELEKCPEKVRARALVNQRVRFGRMPKASSLKCSHCEQMAAHYHHHNGYAFENRYDVVPVCVRCHREQDQRVAS